MSAGTITVTRTIEVESCVTCGTPFGVEEQLLDRLKRDKTYYYCPNGHTQHYMGKSFSAQLADAQEQANAATQKTRQLEELLKAVEARRDRRSKWGMCQHCHRHFQNVERHMGSKHPEIGAKQ